MPIKMETRNITVSELLSSENNFRMPAFQRPYSWGEEQAALLYDDIATAFLNTGNVFGDTEEAGTYFLGLLIVSREAPSAPYDVVDGQQRLVTLSAILAILRDMLPPGGFRDRLQSYICCPHSAVHQLLDMPRVALRQMDQEEYARWIAEPGGTLTAPNTGDTDATTQLAGVIHRIKDDISV
jgi:hypothetical protein